MRALGYFALKDLFHDRWRSLLTIISLAVVVVSYLLLTALSQAYLSFGKLAQTSTNLMIIDANALDPMESSLQASILQAAAQIAPDQILATFPSLFRHLDIQGHILQIRAVPMEDMQNRLSLTLLKGSWPVDRQQMVVTDGLIQVTQWKIGTIANIYGKDFQVTGIVRSSGSQFASIWMTYAEGLSLFGNANGFQIGYVQLNPSADPEKVRAMLQSDPRINAQAAVYLETTLADRYNQVNRNLLNLSLVQAVISLLAITFGTYNATRLSLTERGHEILLLHVLGFTQAKLRTFLFTRSLILTLAAYLVGWSIAWALITYQGLHAPISIQAAPLILSLPLISSLLGLLLSVCFAFIGVWLTTGSLARRELSALRD
jgi:ABC-type antimicrobial peptide transport system permease subunit